MILKSELTKRLHMLERKERVLIRANRHSLATAVKIEIEEVNAALFGIRIWRFDKYKERTSL